MGAKNWRKKTKENGEVSEREMGVFWRLWESGSVLGDFCCWLQIEGDFRCCYREIFQQLGREDKAGEKENELSRGSQFWGAKQTQF